MGEKLLIITYKGKTPVVDSTVFLASGSKLIGEVQVGATIH